MPQPSPESSPVVDIAIVGGGPVGLAFARSLQGSGLRVLVIERQRLQALEQPASDGREIALTHASRRILESLGVWDCLHPADISPLRDAQIFNGPSPFALNITAQQGGVEQLGYFVPNHLIRQALFGVLQDQPGFTLRSGVGVEDIQTGTDCHTLRLSDGQTVQARLVVAADSRHSQTRRMMGIGAALHDFGRTMLVCRFAHEVPHHHITWQWFDHAQTLALLPLNRATCLDDTDPDEQDDGLGEDSLPYRSNVVLTLPPHEMQQMQALDELTFSANIQRRFAARLGAMQQVGAIHTYPLVAVYAHRFAASRYALIGDAAVGMHPITAHGFNFGLQGQQRLADRIWLAHRRHQDFAADSVLQSYERAHRLATWPLYQTTNAIATLYTDDRAPARLVRDGALRLANAVLPFKKAIAAHLSQAS